MRPVPHQHMRAAYVIALDIPIPPPPYLMPDLEIIARWLRGVIELGLEHAADQEDVALSAVCDAAVALDDPDLTKFIGPRPSIAERVARVAHEIRAQAASPVAEDGAALRKMARRLAHERRRARAWEAEAEHMRSDLEQLRSRAEGASTFAHVRSQEVKLALEYRPGRVFQVAAPEPDCDLVVGDNGVLFRHQSAGGSYARWVAQPPNGDGQPFDWSHLVSPNGGAWPLTEMLPLV